MANALPRFIALEWDGRYLQYVEEEGDFHGFLRFAVAGEEVLSPYSKFQVERAQSSEDLVHIRSCYNNKYLMRRSRLSQVHIVAGADEPEEDQSKPSCTLIRPQLHTQYKHDMFTFAIVRSEPFGLQMTANPANPRYLMSRSPAVLLTVIDMESLAILPRFFTLKGDNGKYLRATLVKGNEHHLHYDSDNIKDPKVRFEAFPTPEGNVRIKSSHFGRFWRRGGTPNWIWGDSTDTTANNRDTVFQPIRLGHNDTGNKFIALKCLGNNQYCKRLNPDNCLHAPPAANVEPEAEIEVEEAVRAREIYDVCYRTGDAKIYDSRPGIILVKDVVNRSPTSTQTGEVPFTYTETHTETWDSSHSWKVGVSTKIRAGVPFVIDKEISIETSYEGQVSWGESKETSTEIGTKVEVEVPPMTKLKVGMIVAKAAIDVPFSYTQRDTLLDGTIVTYRMHDGSFTGVNTHVSYDIKEEPLSSNSLTAPAAAKL